MKNKQSLSLRDKNIIIAAVIALLVGGAAGFFGGMKYQQSKSGNQTSQSPNRMGRFGSAGNRNNMAVRGQIIASDSNSITVKLMDGSTKIIVLSSSTMIGKTTTGSISDLTNGANVTVFGTTNSDGSVTAQNVQVGNGVFFGGPRPSGSPAASPMGY